MGQQDARPSGVRAYSWGRDDDGTVRPRVEYNEVLCTTNPLGIKGAGEAGTVGALAAVINAVVDALSGLGVRHVEMPATPERIWQAIAAAKKGA